MTDPLKVVAFDVDPDSLAALRQAFPEWEVQALSGATAASLAHDWDPGAAALLVVGAREQLTGTLALCRGLRSQAGRARAPLLVLVQPAQEASVRAALEAGADSCLVLPIHAKDLGSMVSRAQSGSQPGRHTLDLHRVQGKDAWQDDGGEG
jgi:DNA-binding response OmpR family regulator